MKILTGHKLLLKMQKNYLLKDDNDESIYPTKCFQLFSNDKGGKPLNLDKFVAS